MGFFDGEKSVSGNIFSDELRAGSRTARDYALNNFSPIFRPDASGFMPYQLQGLNTFAQQLFGKTSGDFASRGFMSPESNQAVIGSALTQAAPTLFEIQNQNQLLPGTIRGQNLGDYINAFGPMIQGGQYSKSKGPNVLARAVSGWASPEGWGSFMTGLGNLAKGAKPGGVF